MRHLWTLHDVGCPFCGAGFDQPCRVASGPGKGRHLPTFHEDRRTAFRTAKAAEPVRSAP